MQPSSPRRTTSTQPANFARLKHKEAVKKISLWISKLDNEALQKLIDTAEHTASMSTLIRRSIRCYCVKLSTLKGEALEREMAEASKETYAASGS